MLSSNVDSGYHLLHEGVIALSQIEANGIRIDTVYLEKTINEVDRRIAKLRTKIREHEIGRLWQRKFGLKTNYDSRTQLGKILFSPKNRGGLGFIPEAATKAGHFSTEESSLDGIKIPFVKGYQKLQRLIKVNGTYLKALQREVDKEGRLHPVYSLHTVQTYRSSSSEPNFQNMPIRDPESGKLVRECFIASENCLLVEHDFKGIEVSVAACYHKDPVMLSYIKDPTKDMHRDMAMQIYQLSKEEWSQLDTKMQHIIRHAAKNQFVFPEFYGDWYMSCAQCLWDEIDRRSFLGPDGNSLKKHLRKKGICELGSMLRDQEGEYESPEEGTFLKYIQEVEEDFWHHRFKKYGQWKRFWYDQYLKRGYFDTLTGFHIEGFFSKNQVINYPVQGSAFHCLLWSLIRINRELRRKKMQTKIVGQIHDSILADVPVGELKAYLEIVKRITTVEIQKEFKWLILPLMIECEIAPLGKSWHHKTSDYKVT